MPDPRATNGTPCSSQAFTTAATCSADSGSTTSARSRPVVGEAVALVGAQPYRVGDHARPAGNARQPIGEPVQRGRAARAPELAGIGHLLASSRASR